MSFFRQDTLDSIVEDLLEREHQAILAGDLKALAALVAEKTRLTRRLRDQRPDPRTIGRLRRKAARNHQLLLMVGQGIRAAAQTLKPKPEQPTGFVAYDAKGQARELDRPRPSLWKRA